MAALDNNYDNSGTLRLVLLVLSAMGNFYSPIGRRSGVMPVLSSYYAGFSVTPAFSNRLRLATDRRIKKPSSVTAVSAGITSSDIAPVMLTVLKVHLLSSVLLVVSVL